MIAAPAIVSRVSGFAGLVVIPSKTIHPAPPSIMKIRIQAPQPRRRMDTYNLLYFLRFSSHHRHPVACVVARSNLGDRDLRDPETGIKILKVDCFWLYVNFFKELTSYSFYSSFRTTRRCIWGWYVKERPNTTIEPRVNQST